MASCYTEKLGDEQHHIYPINNLNILNFQFVSKLLYFSPKFFYFILQIFMKLHITFIYTFEHLPCLLQHIITGQYTRASVFNIQSVSFRNFHISSKTKMLYKYVKGVAP